MTKKQADLLPPATVQPEPLATQDSSVDMVIRAVESGASAEQLELVMRTIKFADEREAEKAFNSAFTTMQGELPIVRKSATSHHGSYASLAATVAAVRPVLSAHGFSFRHEVETADDGTQHVTCIIAHRAGHSTKCTLRAKPDTSGSKNAIQAMGSCNSYLRRYSLLDALGIVAGDDPDDDGGRPVPVEVITEEQLRDLCDAVESKGKDADRWHDRICKAYRVKGLMEIPASKYDEIMEKFNDRR